MPQAPRIDTAPFLHNPLFAGLDAQTLQTLAAKGHMIHTRKHQLLFVNQDRADYCYFIRKGRIRLFRESEDGEKVVLDTVASGQIFGETSFFNNGLHSYSAETLEKTDLISLPTDFLKTMLDNNHRFCRNLLDHIAAKSLSKERELETRSLQEAPQRIGCFLLGLCSREKTDGAETVKLPYEKVVIAEQLGMRPETFSRALLKLQKDTEITVKGREVMIGSVKNLVDYTCEACSHQPLCRRNALS